jgi:DNA modification methylase
LNSKEATNAGNLGLELPNTNACSLCGAWRGELGLEPTIELYIKHLMQIFNEVKRVLKRTGTCWVVMDDSYAGSWGDSGHRPERDGKAGYQREKNTEWYQREGHPQFNPPTATIKSVPAKSLCLIPSRFALAMVENGWILRNDIVWNKPNPMPESVKDRFTTSWEHLFFFSKSKHYFFEQQFDEYTEPLNRWGGPKITNVTDSMAQYREEVGGMGETSLNTLGKAIRPNELGRNKRDVWEVCTVPSPKHDGIRNFATYPEKLCETPILAGCPDAICKRCGGAREKVYKETGKIQQHWAPGTDTTTEQAKGKHGASSTLVTGYKKTYKEDGYTDCGCNAGFEPGVVLDQFCGSGTTLAVAKRLGRKAIGIDINPDYCKLAVKRLQEIPMAMELVGT